MNQPRPSEPIEPAPESRVIRTEELSEPLRSVAEQSLRRHEIRGELRIARVALLICLAGTGFALVAALSVDRRLGRWLPLVALGYACYYLCIIALLRRGRYRAWLAFVTSTLEVSCASIIALVDASVVSPAYALTSSPSALYFLAILATALRLRVWLSLYAGALAALEVAGLYLLMAPGVAEELVAVLPSLSPSIYLQRSGYLMLAGLLAAAVSAMANNQVRRSVSELTRRHQLRLMFGRYVSDAVAEKILSGALATGGELREVTVLCSDVRGFTPYAAGEEPPEVVRFLNALFEEQCEIIGRHGGHVDKFMGDGLLAVFGAPLPRADHALCAARAALEIAALRRASLPCGPAELRLGVALHTGPVVMGNVGSRERTEYTAIGRTVNLAFRLEGLNARFGTAVILSEETRDALGPRAIVRALAPAKVRGLDEEVKTFALDALAD